MKNWKLPKSLNTPLGLMVVLGSIIAAVELLIMLVILPKIIPEIYWDFADPILLTLIVSPALYFLVFRKMQESKERYRNIIQTSMDCFWHVDPEGRILNVNDAYCQLSGYTREELLNMHISDVEAKETSGETAQHIHTILTKGYDRFDTQHRHKDGQLLDIEVSVVYQHDTEGGHLFAFLHDITGRKQTEEKIRNLALHDTLTQLPNRRLLNDRLDQTLAASKRSGRYGALIFLDLDNFKPLNDTHGHGVGDLLLIEAARRITGCVREMDTCARFGGDEFVVISASWMLIKPSPLRKPASSQRKSALLSPSLIG